MLARAVLLGLVVLLSFAAPSWAKAVRVEPLESELAGQGYLAKHMSFCLLLVPGHVARHAPTVFVKDVFARSYTAALWWRLPMDLDIYQVIDPPSDCGEELAHLAAEPRVGKPAFLPLVQVDGSLQEYSARLSRVDPFFVTIEPEAGQSIHGSMSGAFVMQDSGPVAILLADIGQGSSLGEALRLDTVIGWILPHLTPPAQTSAPMLPQAPGNAGSILSDPAAGAVASVEAAGDPELGDPVRLLLPADKPWRGRTLRWPLQVHIDLAGGEAVVRCVAVFAAKEQDSAETPGSLRYWVRSGAGSFSQVAAGELSPVTGAHYAQFSVGVRASEVRVDVQGTWGGGSVVAIGQIAVFDARCDAQDG